MNDLFGLTLMYGMLLGVIGLICYDGQNTRLEKITYAIFVGALVLLAGVLAYDSISINL